MFIFYYEKIENIYSKKSIMLAQTSSRSSPSPGVEINQRIVTCFDLLGLIKNTKKKEKHSGHS